MSIGSVRLAQEAESRRSCLIKTPDRISERPPRGGLSVSAAWRRFACVEKLPPDQATPFWQAAQAKAVMYLERDVGIPAI
jgi:hypothetical protein